MKSTQWLKDARFTSWWLEFQDLGWPDPDLTDKWRRRAQTFQGKGVNAVVFCGFHFRWDYIFILDRVLGALREITEICHDHGMKVVEHHSATRIQRARSEEDRRTIQAQKHHRIPFYPDSWNNLFFDGKKMANWRQISARDEEPVFFENNTKESFCPNNPEFQEAYFALIDRHLTEVPFDAVMSDDLHFFPDVYSCSCTHCRKRFVSETGFELPSADDSDFWENRENPAFVAWVSARYRWNADHYRRLRKQLPAEVLLWGCASRCLSTELAQLGFSPQLFAEHFDAICHKISHRHQPSTHLGEITAETAAFNSIAHFYRKPLIAHCYVNSSDELSGWLHLLKQQDARPWISKQVLNKDAAPEEQLLEHGFHYPKTLQRKPTIEPIQAIVFSETFRDGLESEKAKNYVDRCRELCADLVARGSRPFLVFDTMWDAASPALWECLWILDSDALDESKHRKIRKWQQQGLAIGNA